MKSTDSLRFKKKKKKKGRKQERKEETMYIVCPEQPLPSRDWVLWMSNDVSIFPGLNGKCTGFNRKWG